MDYSDDVVYEKCVTCDTQTHVPDTVNVELRAYYVEGAGQLCKSCYDEAYGGSSIPTR